MHIVNNHLLKLVAFPRCSKLQSQASHKLPIIVYQTDWWCKLLRISVVYVNWIGTSSDVHICTDGAIVFVSDGNWSAKEALLLVLEVNILLQVSGDIKSSQ